MLVKGSGQLARIGSNGGFLGHVMVVVSKPELVMRHSARGQALAEIWPESAAELLRVESVESTRQRCGLHRSHMLIQVLDGQLLLVGEESATELAVAGELLELWHCPAQLRESFRPVIMAGVLQDMLESQRDWSFATAARAIFTSADVACRERSEELREELESCWERPPICTSIVISFWQRYLQGLAHATGASDLDLMLRYMPLKADRGLPGELLRTMERTGWRKLAL